MKKDPIMKMLEIMELQQIARLLNESAETCLGFVTIPTDEDALAIGTSKVGGHPDLPSSVPWPMWKKRYLDFLLQLNLVEMPQDLRCDLLPKSGWLYFFYHRKSNTWGFDPQDRGSWKVLFFDATEDSLVRTGKPGAPGRASRPACRVEFYEALPPDWTSVRDRPELKNHAEEVRKFDSLLAALPGITGHRIMGYPDPIQSSTEGMQENASSFPAACIWVEAAVPPSMKTRRSCSNQAQRIGNCCSNWIQIQTRVWSGVTGEGSTSGYASRIYEQRILRTSG